MRLDQMFLALSFALATLPALAAPPVDLCKSAKNADAAKAALAQVEKRLNSRPDVRQKVTSTGFLTCDPATVRNAADAGSGIPNHLVQHPVCGAYFQLDTDQDVQEFARWLVSSAPKAAVISCVGKPQSHHHPAVSGGN